MIELLIRAGIIVLISLCEHGAVEVVKHGFEKLGFHESPKHSDEVAEHEVGE